MQRRASAQWRGGLKDGKGTVSTASGALKTVAYGFAMRFENEPGTNPEELVAAAHASCFAMAFSSELGKAGYRPDLIEVKATLDFDKADAGWSVKSIHRGELEDAVLWEPSMPPDRQLKILGSDVAGKDILEIACGGGQSAVHLAEQGARVTGVDFSSAQLAHARAFAKSKKVRVRFIE